MFILAINVEKWSLLVGTPWYELAYEGSGRFRLLEIRTSPPPRATSSSRRGTATFATLQNVIIRRSLSAVSGRRRADSQDFSKAYRLLTMLYDQFRGTACRVLTHPLRHAASATYSYLLMNKDVYIFACFFRSSWRKDSSVH